MGLGFNVFVFWLRFLSLMVEKFQQPCFVESVDLVCLFFWLKFIFSMAKGLQQPCFVENMDGIDEDASHQLPIFNFNLHHFQMLRMFIWDMATHCQMSMLHSLWL
jgi:hypothetical protein